MEIKLFSILHCSVCVCVCQGWTKKKQKFCGTLNTSISKTIYINIFDISPVKSSVVSSCTIFANIDANLQKLGHFDLQLHA